MTVLFQSLEQQTKRNILLVFSGWYVLVPATLAKPNDVSIEDESSSTYVSV